MPRFAQLLKDTRHRPWAAPSGPYVMTMSWLDLLFAHWPLPPEQLAPSLPEGLTLDTLEGQAYLSVVPFRMAHVGPRTLSDLPGLSAFPELNLRTYVRARTGEPRPGVWFFSLDADNRFAVWAARRFFHLPYFSAHMSLQAEGDRIAYRSERFHRGAPAARFEASYQPTGAPFRAAPGSLEHWLTERYCLYAVRPDGALLRTEIHHPPWDLQPAALTCELNQLAAVHGLTLPPAPPLLQFSRSQDVIAWLPQRVPAQPGG